MNIYHIHVYLFCHSSVKVDGVVVQLCIMFECRVRWKLLGIPSCISSGLILQRRKDSFFHVLLLMLMSITQCIILEIPDTLCQ